MRRADDHDPSFRSRLLSRCRYGSQLPATPSLRSARPRWCRPRRRPAGLAAADAALLCYGPLRRRQPDVVLALLCCAWLIASLKQPTKQAACTLQRCRRAAPLCPLADWLSIWDWDCQAEPYSGRQRGFAQETEEGIIAKPVASLSLHTTMKKTLVVAFLLIYRVATLVLCCASLAYVAAAPVAMNYSAFRFLIVVLGIQLPFCVTRLFHDVAIVVFHVPLPGNLASTLIVIFEWIVSVLVLAASCSALGVQVYMDKDTGACMFMRPRACRWYKEAAKLGLLASVCSFTIALFLFCLQSSRHAQPPAPAPAHG